MEPSKSSQTRVTPGFLPASRPYSEVLRIIGRLLDEEEGLKSEGIASDGSLAAPQAAAVNRVQQVNIIERGEQVTITWETPDGLGSRSLTHHQIVQLRDLVRHLRRGWDQPADARGWEEPLRTLGQLLDTEQASVRGIFEHEGRFHVSGTLQGEPFNVRYTSGELRIISELRALLRKTRAEPGGRPADPQHDPSAVAL